MRPRASTVTPLFAWVTWTNCLGAVWATEWLRCLHPEYKKHPFFLPRIGSIIGPIGSSECSFLDF